MHPEPVPQMPEKIERRLREVAYEQTGIRLGPDKRSLLMARVQKRLRVLGLRDFQAYMEHFDANPKEMEHFINAITTNTTAFWREAEHFSLLTEQLDRMVRAGKKRVRIWCGASSTGQEPYTLALTCYPFVKEHNADIKILATDIDTNVLQKAAAGWYPSTGMDGVPRAILEWGFRPDQDGYRVIDPVKQLLRFARLNLTRPPYPMKGPMDFVFVRNVMIYLEAPTRQRLVEEVERMLTPGGIFCIGHSESLSGLRHRLGVVRPSVYQMPRTTQ